MKKDTLVLGAAGALALYWLLRKKSPGSHAVSGFWADLARKRGMSGDYSVRDAQVYLNSIARKRAPERGGNGLREDGILGPKTEVAIQSFQQHNGLPATGQLDEETRLALAYFAAASSDLPALKKEAVVLPEEIAWTEQHPGPVTYTPYYELDQQPVTYTPYQMPASPRMVARRTSRPAPVWWAAGSVGFDWEEQSKPFAQAAQLLGKGATYVPGAAQIFGPLGYRAAQSALGDTRTGIQSTSFWDPRYYDFPDAIETWW